MLYRNNSYFIPTYIGTIPTSSHKTVTAAGENICQQEIKNMTSHKSVTAAGENICQREIITINVTISRIVEGCYKITGMILKDQGILKGNFIL